MPAFPPAARLLGRVAVVAALAASPVSARADGKGSRAADVTREGLSRVDAASMRQKVAAIEKHGLVVPPRAGATASAAAAPSRRTRITESEVNSFLAYDNAVEIPVGITQPRIRILGDRRLSGTAVVDLDVVRAHHRSTGWLDPMNFLSGRMPVAVAGRLSSGSGVGWFQLESATISGIPIPKTLLQELVSYYSRTPANPRGLNIDDPFFLPAGIRQIDIGRGEALVVQ